jgi:hypothetical protein
VNLFARDKQDIARHKINPPTIQHQVTSASNQHYRAIVLVVYMGNFAVADLHYMVTHLLRLTERRNPDVLRSRKRIFGEDPVQV